MFIGDDIIVLVYVDDCLVFLQDKDKINQLIDKHNNKEKLYLTDESDVDKYLGVEIEQNKEDKSITFKQTFLIQRAIELVGTERFKSSVHTSGKTIVEKRFGRSKPNFTLGVSINNWPNKLYFGFVQTPHRIRNAFSRKIFIQSKGFTR